MRAAISAAESEVMSSPADGERKGVAGAVIVSDLGGESAGGAPSRAVSGSIGPRTAAPSSWGNARRESAGSVDAMGEKVRHVAPTWQASAQTIRLGCDLKCLVVNGPVHSYCRTC